MSSFFIKVVLIFTFIALQIESHAHDLGVVRIQLAEKDSFHYTLLVKLSIETRIFTPDLQLPADFVFSEKPVTVVKELYSLTYYRFTGNRSLHASDILLLPWELDGAFIESIWLDGTIKTVLVKESKEGISIDIAQLRGQDQSALKVVKDYVLLGIEHILFGWDHLAFVLVLCLIAMSSIQLIKLITAFTLGHSITLALASLGIVNIPIPPVEACIAISIALVASEAYRGQAKTNNITAVVVAFGLLHGLGFASVLSEIGIEKSALFLGLVSFNVGVEIGQVMFVLVAFTILKIVEKKVPEHSFDISKAISFSLGVIAFFWFFERMESFYY